MAKAKSAKPAYEQIKIRVRGETRKKLEEAAKASGQTLNGELVKRIDESLNNDFQQQIKDLQMLNSGLLMRSERQGKVLSGYLENELRKAGVAEDKAQEILSIVRAYTYGGDR